MTSNREENHTPSDSKLSDTQVLKPRKKSKVGLKKKRKRIKQAAVRFEQVKRCILLKKYFKCASMFITLRVNYPKGSKSAIHMAAIVVNIC